MVCSDHSYQIMVRCRAFLLPGKPSIVASMLHRYAPPLQTANAAALDAAGVGSGEISSIWHVDESACASWSTHFPFLTCLQLICCRLLTFIVPPHPAALRCFVRPKGRKQGPVQNALQHALGRKWSAVLERGECCHQRLPQDRIRHGKALLSVVCCFA